MPLRTLHHSEFPAERIAAEREDSVSVCLPARNEVETIGPILRCLMPLLHRRVIDQVVVVDDSTDGTAEVALALGAEVHRQSDLCPQYGPVTGKGDAMWRALTVLWGDVVCFFDADSGHFGEHYACGLVGAAACDPASTFVKGYYRRPFLAAGVELPEGGGRVSELMARPLLNRFYPELAAFFQPLAGEVAARRELLMSLPFATGYGVDIGLLVDTLDSEGLARMAQVDLEVRQNRHQSLHDLVPMADAVLEAILRRLPRDGRLGMALLDGAPLPGAERPPLATLVNAV
jgi:glucosyl-3-phosphoglycerate synthase